MRKMVLIAVVMLLTAATAGAVGASAARPAMTARPCGAITWHQAGFTFHDRVYVKRGHVACATVRNVLYDAYASPPAYGGWHCRYYEQRRAYVSCRRDGVVIFGKGTS